MFFISRFLVDLFAPLNFSISLLIVSLLCLVLKRVKVGTLVLSLALSIQLLCGYGIVGKEQIAKREQYYPAFTKEHLASYDDVEIKYIVVLGSGHVSDWRLPETSQIGESSLYRLVEGVRMLNHFPRAKIVLSGGVGYDPVPNADLVESVAVAMGVNSERIIVESRPRDTVEEAQFLEPLLRGESFMLVTSALHLRRAILTFQSYGMQPIPVPTDYLIKRHVVKPPGTCFPSTANLELSRRIIYEWIGTIWGTVKKSIKKYL